MNKEGLLAYFKRKQISESGLIKKYEKIIEANAKKYTKKSNNDYRYWLEECYYILLCAYRADPFIASGEVIKALNIGLRDSYRGELRRRWELFYGLSSVLDNFDGENPQTEAQKVYCKIAREKADKEDKEALEFTKILDAFEELGEREQAILVLYFWNGCKEKEIANYYNISIPMVSKIKKRALEKCRKFLERGDLKKGASSQ